MRFLRFRQRDRDLGQTVLEVDLGRDDRETLLRRGAEEFADFALVEKEFAGTSRGRIVVAAGSVARNRHPFQPDFAVANVGVRFVQARFAITERLYLGPCKHESRLPRLQEMVIVPGFRVPGDGDFFHAVIGKIRIDLGLYNDLDCRSSKKSLAEVVELVDALASGASGRKPVGVRVPPSALSIVVPPDPLPAPTHRSLPPGCARSRIRLL